MPENAFAPGPTPHSVTRHTPPTGQAGFAPHTTVAPFFPQAVPRFTQCPPPPPDLTEPSPANLVYGMTLPSATATPSVAQESAEIMLDVHAVEEAAVDPMLLLVYELTAHACRFTSAGEMVHLVVRLVEGAFQVTVHDTHAAHTHRVLATMCDRRRRSSLTDVRELVEKHQGAWGFGSAHPPAVGVCTWATLMPSPHTQAAENPGPALA
ncbi:hypothetical protein GCM10009716_38930 [Streptomyces sodiiphilus]|uniref:ATP-binding protein n=1 Tax=Streptomyces sodiiphilus TaxID=226217 RepID=A0ABN2PPL5_9ACTN